MYVAATSMDIADMSTYIADTIMHIADSSMCIGAHISTYTADASKDALTVDADLQPQLALRKGNAVGLLKLHNLLLKDCRFRNQCIEL